MPHLKGVIGFHSHEFSLLAVIIAVHILDWFTVLVHGSVVIWAILVNYAMKPWRQPARLSFGVIVRAMHRVLQIDDGKRYKEGYEDDRSHDHLGGLC